VALGIGFPDTILPGSAYASWVFMFVVVSAPQAAQFVDNFPRLKCSFQEIHWKSFKLTNQHAIQSTSVKLEYASEEYQFDF
jgi:hypothetical protein